MEDRQYTALGTTFRVRYGSENPEETYQVYEKFWECYQHHPFYAVLRDKDRIFMSISTLNHHGQIAYFYHEDKLIGAVAFTIQRDALWWCRADIVEELFVLAMDDTFHGFGRVAAQFLKDMCAANACDLVLTGTALGSNNSYRKVGGYSFEYPSFVCLRKDC